ncbi:MAG: amidohydrolase family protein [Pseudomonadota bacterium]
MRSFAKGFVMRVKGVRSFLAALLGILMTGCSTHHKPAPAPSGVLYHGFTLLDPAAERVVRNAYVLVDEGRIQAVGAGGWHGAPVQESVDMRGHYALPGFVDGHAHITSGPHTVEVVDGAPRISIPSVDSITRFHAAMALAFGVTTVRNPGGDPVANARYDAMVRAGDWIGPEAIHAGAVIQPPPFGGSAFAYPRTEGEWQAEARRQAALGMRYFKLYSGLSKEELATGIRVAHQHGLKAIAHLDSVSWTEAARMGIDGLEHALPTSADLLEPAAKATYLVERGADARYLFRWFELADLDGPLIQDMIGELAGRKVVVSTTLFVNQLTYNSDRLDAVLPLRDRAYIHPESLKAMLAFLPVMSEDDHRRARAAMPKVLEFVRRLHRAGVPILVGTDGNGGGPAFSTELELHTRAGLPVWEVLRLATSDAAAMLGIDQRTGRLSRGLEADIVFLRNDPLRNILHVRDVGLVLNNGTPHDPATLMSGIPERP